MSDIPEPTPEEQVKLPKGATIKPNKTYDVSNVTIQPKTEVHYVQVPIGCCPRCGWKARA